MRKRELVASNTAEEVRDEHLRILGPALGPVYDALYNEVVWLHAKWNQYGILYGESQKRIGLLNRTAGFFFRMIQNVLWEDVLMHIARLTDPPRSAGKDNLTLLRLSAAVDVPELRTELQALAERAQNVAAFARDWRNRRLAHADLKLALEDQAQPLPGLSRHQVEEMLAAAAAVLNRVWVYYARAETAFGLLIAHDDAESLAYYLENAVTAEDREREEIFGAGKKPKDSK